MNAVIETGRKPAPAPGAQFIRNFIENNYLYAFSALFMMIGAYALMQANPHAGRAILWPLRALLVLQGYELLVIATAAVIVKRLGVLSDAFILLLVELALLLDPTCFANSFHTLYGSEGSWVNVACFALVPLKLAILQYALRLRVSPRMFGAVVLAAAVVYLGAWPISLERYRPYRLDLFYGMTWFPLLVAIALPALRRAVASVGGRDFTTGGRIHMLAAWLVGVPMVVTATQLLDTRFVYDLPLRPMILAPLFLALAVLYLKNSGAGERWPFTLMPVDLLAAAALVASLARTNPGFEQSALLAWTPPLAWMGLAVAGVYVYAWRRFEFHRALYRIVALAVLGGIYLLMRTALPGMAWIAAQHTTGAVWHYLGAHPYVVEAPILVGLLALAWRVPHAVTWLFGGMFSLVFLARYLPIDAMHWIPEIVQVFFVLLFVIYHRFGDTHNNRAVAFGCIVLIGLGRLAWMLGTDVSAAWYALPAIEFALLAATAWWMRGAVYFAGALVYGMLAGIVYALVALTKMPFYALALAAGLVLFAAGIGLTFAKDRILARMDRPPVEEELPDPEVDL